MFSSVYQVINNQLVKFHDDRIQFGGRRQITGLISISQSQQQARNQSCVRYAQYLCDSHFLEVGTEHYPSHSCVTAAISTP